MKFKACSGRFISLFASFFVSLGLLCSFAFAQGFEPVPMRREYEGENLRAKDPVHYYDEHALKAHEVVLRDGLILDRSGTPITSYLNQSSIYVITSDYRFLISRYSKHNLIHHSSLSAGAPLLASGELVIQDGVLLRINLESGHYRFPERYLEFVKSYLAERGVRLDGVVFESCVGSLKVASHSSKVN